MSSDSNIHNKEQLDTSDEEVLGINQISNRKMKLVMMAKLYARLENKTFESSAAVTCLHYTSIYIFLIVLKYDYENHNRSKFKGLLC